MTIDKLIDKLQDIAAEYGGKVKVRVRDYRGYFEPLTKVKLEEKYNTIWLEAPQR